MVSVTTCANRSAPVTMRGVGVQPREQGVVVQHLLEVGDQPPLVDRVAREAAADVVVHASGRHGVERGDDRLERSGGTGAVVVSEEVSEAHRLGNFGARPNPPHCWSKLDSIDIVASSRVAIVGRSSDWPVATSRRSDSVRRSACSSRSGRRSVHASCTRVHDLGERRMPASTFRWEVGAAEERARPRAS